jgi:glycopeptide antibiotics resistance protein
MLNVLRRFVLPAAEGMFLLFLEFVFCSNIAVHELLCIVICIAATAVITALTVLAGRGFDGCGVFAVTVSGGLMVYYAWVVLAHRNVFLGENAYITLAVNWASLAAVCVAARLFDRNGRLKGFGAFFRTASISFFVIYAAVLAYALFFKNDLGSFLIRYRAINLVPFKTILGYFNGEGNSYGAVDNILGNLLLFLPLGFYLNVFKERISLPVRIAIIFALPVLCEILQYVLSVGSSDIDDVILDALGAFAGMLLFTALETVYRALHKGGGRLFIWGRGSKAELQ